jgi:hypothetical protein
MKYVLGAGISGLLWAYYHSDFKIVTDKIGWSVAGVDPQLLLYDKPESRRLMFDLGLSYGLATKPIGCLTNSGRIVSPEQLTDAELEIILTKKLVPWNILRMAKMAGVTVEVSPPQRTFGAGEADRVTYLTINVEQVIQSLLHSARQRRQILEGVRVRGIGENTFGGQASELEFENCPNVNFCSPDYAEFEYDELVSTLPAPVFSKAWAGGTWHGRPWSFNYSPVTVAVLKNWDRSWNVRDYCFVYDAVPASPVSRLSSWQDGLVQIEITGAVSRGDMDIEIWNPSDMYIRPYGRIVGDYNLSSPSPKIKFLGRWAQWNYSVYTHHVLRTVLNAI